MKLDSCSEQDANVAVEITGHNELEWAWTVPPLQPLQVIRLSKCLFQFDLHTWQGSAPALDLAAELEWQARDRFDASLSRVIYSCSVW